MLGYDKTTPTSKVGCEAPQKDHQRRTALNGDQTPPDGEDEAPAARVAPPPPEPASWYKTTPKEGNRNMNPRALRG
jgi:hypothetical protein